MKEVILVTAAWCPSCHGMENWFIKTEIPGVTLRVKDVEEVMDENISSVPALLFKENNNRVQEIFGAIGQNDFKHKVQAIWT